MASFEISHVDLETGERRSGGAGGGSSTDWDSVYFSDAEEGSCISQFFSTYGGSYDDYGISDSRRISSAAVSDCSVIIDGEMMAEVVHVEMEIERDCRICHLTLLEKKKKKSNSDQNGIAIHLGCSCKDDLGAAHKQCAETWFKIKGNTTCEICNSIAVNVFSENLNDSIAATQQQPPLPAAAAAANITVNENLSTIGAVAVPSSYSEESRRLDGQKLVNILLICMVIAFIISWIFHFKIPS